MKTLRRIYRLIAIPIWLIGYSFRMIPSRYLASEEKATHRAAYLVRGWGRGLAAILGYRLHIHGDSDQYTKRGGLIISNHQSYIDILINACLYGCRFTPKIEIKKWPFFGWYVGLSMPIWIDRKNKQDAKHVMEESNKTIRMKIPLVVYPEGTTTDGRSGLLPFKTTLFESVAGTGIPIQPIINLYHPKAGDYHPAWFGTATFTPHLWALLGNRTIDTDIYILPPIETEGMDRKALAVKAHEIMQEAYNRYYVPDERKEYVE